MGDKSRIEWTEATWNPVTGCTKVSQGCKHCYAETMAKRLQAMGQANYANGFKLTLQPHMLDQPLRWKRPRRIFVNSMSDLFHADVPLDYIRQVFDVMRQASWHTFQVLTKRADRLAELAPLLDWPVNVWMGVTVEHADTVGRIDQLRTVPAAVRFLSCEPLVGAIGPVDLTGIHWVIAGGESGHGARPMHPVWVRELRDQCQDQGVAFFFKQWGEHGPGAIDMTTQTPVIREFTSFDHWVAKAQTWVNGGVCVDTSGKVLTCGADFQAAAEAGRFPVAIVHRLGKGKAGRVLDGREWDEVPAQP